MCLAIQGTLVASLVPEDPHAVEQLSLCTTLLSPASTLLSPRSTLLSPRSTLLTLRSTLLSPRSKAWESQLLSPHTASIEACALQQENPPQ